LAAESAKGTQDPKIKDPKKEYPKMRIPADKDLLREAHLGLLRLGREQEGAQERSRMAEACSVRYFGS